MSMTTIVSMAAIVAAIIVVTIILLFLPKKASLEPNLPNTPAGFDTVLGGNWTITQNQTYSASAINNSGTAYYPGLQSVSEQHLSQISPAQSQIAANIFVENFNNASSAAVAFSAIAPQFTNSSSLGVSGQSSSGTYNGLSYLYLNGTERSTEAFGFSQFLVLGQACGPSGLEIQLSNNGAGVPATITGEYIDGSTGLVGNASGNLTSYNLSAGASVIIGFKPVYCQTAGLGYNARITIVYDEHTGLGTERLFSSGDISRMNETNTSETKFILKDDNHIIQITFTGAPAIDVSLVKIENLFSDIGASLTSQAPNIAQTTVGFSSIGISSYACNATGTYLKFQNTAGTTIAMENAQIISSSGVNGVYNYVFNPQTLSNGQSSVLSLTGAYCTTVNGTGSRYSEELNITYKETTAQGNETFDAIGIISGMGS